MSISGSRMRGMRLGLVSLILAFGSNPIVAEDDSPSKKPSRMVLFDGKTLEGWKKAETYKAGGVKVEDGTIVFEAGGPMTAITSTRTDLPTTDYELTFEAKRVSGGDFFAAATFPVGKSFVTFVNGGWGGSVTGLSSLNGADASENDTRRFVKYENGTWYKFRIHVTDDVIRCWIDEKQTVAVNYQDIPLKTRIESRPCQPLGFASYRSAGAVRAVEIRSLAADEIKSNNQAAER
jgi:Domain of Unknown Function (DUF1080)